MNITNPGYAIGIIFYYQPGIGHSNSVVNYSFLLDNKEYSTVYTSGSRGRYVPVLKGYKKGDMFMVQYNLDHIETNRFLFNYPVTDSADYKGYVEEFKTASPRLK